MFVAYEYLYDRGEGEIESRIYDIVSPFDVLHSDRCHENDGIVADPISRCCYAGSGDSHALSIHFGWVHPWDRDPGRSKGCEVEEDAGDGYSAPFIASLR